MNHRFLPHAVAALVGTAILGMILSYDLGPQIPVDLRPMPRFQQALRSVGVAPTTYDPKYDFLAMRYVLNDLRVRIGYLQEETTNLYKDTDFLWTSWKNLYGLRGGLMDWGGFLQRSPRSEATPRVEHLQVDIFALDGKVQQLGRDTQQIAGMLQKAEDRWWGIGEEIGNVLQGKGTSLAVENSLESLRENLSKLADRMNALDSAVRARHEDLDDAYLRTQHFVDANSPGALILPKPWHWDYMLSDRPRPSIRYDFDANYQANLERAYQSIDAAAHSRISLPASRRPNMPPMQKTPLR